MLRTFFGGHNATFRVSWFRPTGGGFWLNLIFRGPWLLVSRQLCLCEPISPVMPRLLDIVRLRELKRRFDPRKKLIAEPATFTKWFLCNSFQMTPVGIESR
jgi:hypothetical protein